MIDPANLPVQPAGGRRGKPVRWVLILIAGVALFGINSQLRANSPLHAEVLVFVPSYEGSQLLDPDLGSDRDDPLCVWGNYNVFLSSRRYFALRMPNPLEARPLLAVGPLDVYRGFVSALTEHSDAQPDFHPYTLGADFFIFAYDWRQEIGSVSAPQLREALDRYAKIHEARTGLPAGETKFVIVTHSMGGLVIRTLLSERPAWADRISGLYLVGSPNAGCVKATRTVIVGPDSIGEYAHGFPGVLLNLIPTSVDQNVTKLVGITRPSLYELLPTGDPHWSERLPDGSLRRMDDADVMKVSSWDRYWPSAGLEKKLFLDGWLEKRLAEGRKAITEKDWEFCQDPDHAKLRILLSDTAKWRSLLGPLTRTDRLMTGSDGTSRLKIILSTGLRTPTDVISTGFHDASGGYYLYDPPDSGDGTMEEKRVLDDLSPTAPNVVRLHSVPHGRLMIDPQFLRYFIKELAGGKIVGSRA